MRNLNYKASGIYIAKDKPLKINKAIKIIKVLLNYYKPDQVHNMIKINKSRAEN